MITLAAISQQIWDMKYRLKAADGSPVDKTIEDTLHRVANALAEQEKKPEYWASRFYTAMAGFHFIPAGRILAGAGTMRNVTLFNCFVMGTIPDDISGIFEQLQQAALTMQQGGGIGYDFSTLRPAGAPVRGVGADAAGPLSFMDVWDAMCRTIVSAGTRRGAMMATMRCDHPDIEAFIAAKRQPEKLRMFNLSVLVTDGFMHAVREDADWQLRFDGTVHKTLPARKLWDAIMRATYAYAEPGVVFIDRINQRNNLHYCEDIAATNPCGEQPLPPYGACDLGSINLARMIEAPFSPAARLDMAALARVVPVAVRMLDNVIDISGFPLDRQRHEARAKRRIGLGVTGLGDALILCGARYGSADAVRLTEQWLAAIRQLAYRASISLAKEKGAFPLFDAQPYLAGETVRTLDAALLGAIAEHGIRNALVTSIAPTGTISLLAGNVSSGIEPVFSHSHIRRVTMPDGALRDIKAVDYATALYRRMFGETAALPDAFVDAQNLQPGNHIVMQAAAQKYIDSSISKTINVPADTPFESFSALYLHAYETGCKGCTTYRPNDVTGAVLRPDDAPASGSDIVYMTPPLDRPEALPGRTYKLRWPESDHAIYITLNDIERAGRRLPFEVFINSKNMEHYAWTVALTRMISAVFRRGGDVSFVVEELKAVFDPRGGQWVDGQYIPSLLAAIGGVIERHMTAIGFLAAPVAAPSGTGPRQCPKCGGLSLLHQEGCDSCTACDYSRCG
ncbi:MAG: Vitamin B12-dependent ribonucleoside-diphosphate reductase [Alphaproteobacteria bacterium MarineAlpha10_Bin3]|nr:MAG: Vitamin B12-dependent ribonucleoside-diphosphate reductase [Alphaproteobacteria bacterium MarineAlpha10_Bin3]PPR68766.1 MAG: Vitamin B12-dependent ribonucleoside-diphosphate reductase [Alphaproteobacteria bacterium MarineAlpha4_Bin1]